ncbi:1-acyl-sn-glycerol-3-phosphate acyltransferase gamma-like isoform X5 [Daphnia pulex]|uniref:1-acyl-sn-glycerol-3-phosphate acyltransferase gamma-like isoform X5 n=1 Tax=Daphnia pulex TaxID=6669 RepID=UPI001EDDD3D8|nr:1-acyl-sn-glycerol-3-phosphate acyltransferase gamma-like isoform X5 [Daphnia pulex]XP_046438318.1 1-acyl-sn-glycerol-3-phosphate acyltransferase gamma-like isoform X5 [Daphnia pulex]XP_046438319.1 1-acyl-sn-glycerol-3-phosphate acyltransferase gamma-like isoform X5 [Daphnia pulex]
MQSSEKAQKTTQTNTKEKCLNRKHCLITASKRNKMLAIQKLMFLPVVVLFINLFISGLVINLIQLLLWVCVRPGSRWLYQKVNYYLLYILWTQIVFIGEWWSSSTCAILTDDETWSKMGKEHAIVIMNHSFEVDWLMGWLVCEQSRLLASSKVFIKKSIKWIPIIGWAWQFGEAVFLERNWEKDKLIMGKQVKNLGEYADPVWLLLFAEGTRFTPAKHAASVEFAHKSGLQPLQHLLLPRTKGFLLTVQNLRGRFPAIYCATLAFNCKEGSTPTLKNMLLGRRVIGEMLLERIPLETIPENPDEASKWLYNNYRHKDHMLDVYKREGSFPSSDLIGEHHHFRGPIRSHYRPRRLWSVIIMLTTSYFTLPPVLYALYALFCSGFINVLIAVSLVLAVMYALYKLVALTRVSKGSSYGRSDAEKKTY